MVAIPFISYTERERPLLPWYAMVLVLQLARLQPVRSTLKHGAPPQCMHDCHPYSPHLIAPHRVILGHNTSTTIDISGLLNHISDKLFLYLLVSGQNWRSGGRENGDEIQCVPLAFRCISRVLRFDLHFFTCRDRYRYPDALLRDGCGHTNVAFHIWRCVGCNLGTEWFKSCLTHAAQRELI